MKVAVLMTCYNRVETTLRCLRGLFAQKLPEGWLLDVWLVDDGSDDGTGARVAAEFPLVNVMAGGGLFWCKGMRLAWDRAVEAADYDGYFWLNDDVSLVDGALAGLARDIATVGDEAILIGACSTDGPEGEIAYGVSGGTGRWGKLVPTGVPQVTKGTMSGNFVWVPRTAFEKVGPIYGGYSHGYGDYDYGWQADKKGVARYLCSQVVGVCPQQLERYHHRLADLSFWGRVKVLFDRKGFSLRDNFVYKYRNFGLVNAVLSSVHVFWIRVVLKHER